MESADFHIEEAKECQRESVQVIKDAIILSGVVVTGYALLEGAVNYIAPESNFASVLSEKAAEGSALVVMAIGGLGLAGAAHLQAKAGIERLRARKAARAESEERVFYGSF